MNILTFDSSLKGKATVEHRVAHRMLDAILKNGGPCPDICPTGDEPFVSLLQQQYHHMRRSEMCDAGTIEDKPQGDWPEFTLTINWSADPGVLVRAADIHIEKRHRSEFQCALLGARGLAYTVNSIRGGMVSLWFYFGVDDTTPEHPWEDGWRIRQKVQLDRARESFVCPLCGDLTEVMFLCQVSDPHFGCVSCTAILDPEEKQRYEGCRR